MKDHEIAELTNKAVSQPSESSMIWARLAKEAKSCQRTWGMGFPVISTNLLRKYWHEATGFLPNDD